MSPPTMRALSIRVPMDLYVKIADLADERDRDMNYVITQILRIGVEEEKNLNNAIRQMVLDLAGKSE